MLILITTNKHSARHAREDTTNRISFFVPSLIQMNYTFSIYDPEGSEVGGSSAEKRRRDYGSKLGMEQKRFIKGLRYLAESAEAAR